ncbi:MAG: TonB-dependent receptor [Rhodoferax sp.]|nr:TonB-dependent receptor [Rhodoferax sp.]
MKNCLFSGRQALLTLLVGSAFSAYAQTQIQLQNTVVTATRVPQDVNTVVADVSIVDRADLDAWGVSTLTEALAHLPGIQTTGFGDSGRVMVRGADARMTALYVDGVRVDSQDGLTLGGGAPWELVPVSQIERIEVLRGPASAVYGSDAMGGVVHIFTRSAKSSLQPYIHLGVGSLNQQRAVAGLGGSQDAWSYALGLGYAHSDGYDTRPDLSHSPDREPSLQRSASARLGYQFSGNQQLELSTLANRHDSRYVPWGGGVDYTARASLGTAALKWQSRWNSAYRSAVTWSNARVAKQDDAPNDYQTTTQGLLWENTLLAAGGTWTAVLDQRRDAFDAQATLWDPRFGGNRSQNALALGYGAALGAHTMQFNLRNDQDSIFGSHQTGAAAYAYALSAHWRATASTGSAFRAPTLEQVFGPYGSATLQPETNQSSELGVRYVAAGSSFKLVVYRNEISNMISSSASLATCSAGFFCYYNVGKASIEGITLSGRRQFQRLELYGSADFLDPRDAVSGNVLSLRARRSAVLGLDVHWAGWQWGGQWRYVGDRFDNAANTVVLDRYNVLDLSASRRLAKDWRLQVRVSNASDQSYQEVGGYATPGRTLFAGLQWQAGR